MVCGSCGFENEDQMRFCGVCGQPLALFTAKSVCPMCRSSEPSDSRVSSPAYRVVVTAVLRIDGVLMRSHVDDYTLMASPGDSVTTADLLGAALLRACNYHRRLHETDDLTDTVFEVVELVCWVADAFFSWDSVGELSVTRWLSNANRYYRITDFSTFDEPVWQPMSPDEETRHRELNETLDFRVLDLLEDHASNIERYALSAEHETALERNDALEWGDKGVALLRAFLLTY